MKNLKSFRLSAKTLNYIEKWQGKDMTNKLENMIVYFMETELEKNRIIESLTDEENVLKTSIDSLRRMEGSLKLVKSFVEKAGVAVKNYNLEGQLKIG